MPDSGECALRAKLHGVTVDVMQRRPSCSHAGHLVVVSVKAVLAVVVAGERLFGKWSICEEVYEARGLEHLDAPAAEITKNIVKAGRRLLANDAATQPWPIWLGKPDLSQRLPLSLIPFI
jgi:hypothetical protein